MDAWLIDAARTPFGRYRGGLSGIRVDDLAALPVTELLRRHAGRLDPATIDDVVLGNTNGAGEENRNIGRMVMLLAGLPVRVPGVTVNRLCASGGEAIVQAARAVGCGDASLVVAVELGIDRERMDAFALSSHQRAAQAWDLGVHKGFVFDVFTGMVRSPRTSRSGGTPRPRSSPGKQAEDTMVIYYAGHGLTDDEFDDDLYLALPGSQKNSRPDTACAYDFVRREIKRVRKTGKQGVVILDCCFGGRANWGGISADKNLADLILDGGTASSASCVLTAASASSIAKAPVGEPYTPAVVVFETVVAQHPREDGQAPRAHPGHRGRVRRSRATLPPLSSCPSAGRVLLVAATLGHIGGRFAGSA